MILTAYPYIESMSNSSITSIKNKLLVRDLGQQSYEKIWRAMQEFTDNRSESTVDEIWLVEHPPVFTQGRAGKAEHILDSGKIPVVHVDRGGQVTYHGPGQQLVYLMIDIGRKKFGVREFVSLIEESIIQFLSEFNIDSKARPDAPGVYVDGKKVASLGLRIRKNCSFHGFAVNINMDLTPFSLINPCGFKDISMTNACDLGGPKDLVEAQPIIMKQLVQLLQYFIVEHASSELSGGS